MSVDNAQCVTTSWDAATSQRVYTVTSVWAPGGCWGDVLIPAADFQAVVDAGGGGSATGQFSTAEVALIKDKLARPSPFELSSEEGGLIAALVLGVWVVAWCWKQIALMSRTGSESE